MTSPSDTGAPLLLESKINIARNLEVRRDVRAIVLCQGHIGAKCGIERVL